MKLEQTSYSIDNIIPLKESVIEYLRHQNPEENTALINEDDKIQGGILSDIRYSWLAKGPKLEVLHTKTGAKVAAWCFRAQHDFDTSITCVADLGSDHGKAPLLVVGLDCEITGGMVCVFDVGSSRVLRAVQIDDKVTSIEVVSSGFDSSLPGVLRALDGIIAVGTAQGKVFLVDLCRQICEEALVNSYNETIRDEINSCHLIHLDYDHLRDLERYKEESLRQGKHLCLQLNMSSTTDIHFTLFGPSGDIRLRANKSEVIISSLHFSSSLGSLLVGYNFGAWQLYNLLSSGGPLLDYTSPMYEDCIPVGHFAVQEPCDDPRAFCYVWAAYTVQEQGDDGATIAVMYALTYQTKEMLEGYGWLYQELQACSVRFQMELGKVVTKWSKNTGAKCLALRSYTRPLTTDSPDERLALCTLVWSCWDHGSPSAAPHVYMAVFDLNQWYKEQMPAQPRAVQQDNERYIACVSLTDLMAGSGTMRCGNDVLDIRVDPTSLSPFICPSRLEEHYYPSALAFRALVLCPRQLGWLRSAGTQRHLLTQLELAGPLCLLQPADLYHRCVALGLCPAHVEGVAGGGAGQQRRVVLSVALEHQLVRWLCRCARDWANGCQASGGCTLDLLLDWAWQRANTLKFSADTLCVPLFDHTGERLDHNALLQLNHATCQLKHLATLFGTVVQWCAQYFTQQDLDDIRYQWNSLQMISIYLDVLQWLLNVGLLPECPLSMYPLPDDSERMSAPYPVDSLSKYYLGRRAELRGDDDTQPGGPHDSLLFIDQLLQRECGGSTLSKQWQCDGGSGLYPPPSLQALLRTYLVEDIGIESKHCLFIYVFLDLAMTLDQSRYKSIITHLIKFPAVFKLSPSVIKITQAFWQLDHGDFSTAMAQLLDPAVASEDLKPWHHRTVLKALLLQGQHQHALLYQQVRKPPVSSVQDICMVITLLIVNDLLQEAFHFQRQNRSVYNEKEILKHFFTVSDKMNKLGTILQFPLSPSEETAFISYLCSHATDFNQNLQVIYFLQRDRYEEAFRTNDELNAKSGCDYRQALKQGLLGQQERDFRNVIVEGFKKTLPGVTRTLLEHLKDERSDAGVWSEADNVLQPFSAVMHNIFKEVAYKPTLIHASIQKAKETWSKCVKNKDHPFISAPRVVPELDRRNETPLIYASVMQPHSNNSSALDPESEATPAKRMRLSPREPVSSNMRASLQRRSRPSTNSNVTIGAATSSVESPSLSLLDTPIVKRKSYRETERGDGWSPVPSLVGTPTSILKVRSFIRKSQSPDVSDDRGTSTTPEILDADMDGDGDEPELDLDSGVVPLDQSTADAIKSAGIHVAKKLASNISFSKQHHRSPLGVSPRRPIQRTPRPAVHFEHHARPGSRGSSASDTSTGTAPATSKQHLEVRIDVHREQTPQLEHEHDHSSKDSTRSNEEVFYSPNETFEEGADVEKGVAMEVEQPSLENSDSEKVSLKRKANDSCIKSRRSYKTNTPVKVKVDRNIRESLRSRDSLNKSESQSIKSVESSVNLVDSAPEIVEISEEVNTPRKVFPKISGRRSVSPSPKIVVTSIPEESSPKQDIFPKLGGRRSVEPLKTVVPIEIEENSPKKEVYSKLRARRSVEPATNKTTEKTVESSPRKDVFPKVAGRRSLSRQVLEHNALTRALQHPKMQTRLSMTKVPENMQTVGVEVSYSKTVTSIVKKSSDTVTEEKCDKSTHEMKNVFTTEKDSSAQVIKHVHNESSSKSSLKKVTEILNESSDHEENNLQSHDSSSRPNFLTSSSDIDDSVFDSSYQPSERKDESVTSFREEKQNTTQTSCKTNETCADVSVENISELLEDTRNKSTYSSNSVFEDISSIVEESFVSEESDEDEMETSEYVPTQIFQSDKQDKQVKIIEDHLKTNEYVPTKLSQSDDQELSKSEYVPTKIFQSDNKQEQVKTVDELSRDSTEEKISNQSEDSNDDVIIEAEIIEPASQDESVASLDSENEEPEIIHEEQKNYLVPSEDEDSDEEEEQECEEIEEHVEEEEQECEEIEEHVEDSEDNSSNREEIEVGSEDNSSHSSDVIEIKSSSEESNEAHKLNTSEETAENEQEENEEESEREETDNEEREDEVNVREESEEEVKDREESEEEASEHEENENILEQNIEIMEEIEEIPIEVNVEIYEEDRELQMDPEQFVEEIEQMDEDIQVDTTEEIAKVAEIQQDIAEVKENIDLREDFRLELEESTHEQDQFMEKKINEAEEKIQEEEMIQEGEIKQAEKTNQTEEINQAFMLESTEKDIMDKEQEENEEKSQRNISQDCLETISFYQPNEEMHKTDILCSESLANEDHIQKIEMDEKVPQEESYTPSRRSKRITSKQTNVIEEETVPTLQKPADFEAKLSSFGGEPTRSSTRRRSKSVDVEAISKTEDKSKVQESLKPVRSSIRKRSTSVNIEAKPATIEESSIPVHTSTRQKSTSVVTKASGKTAEEKPATKTRKKSTSVDVEAKLATIEASAKTTEEKPATRTRKRSTSIDVESKQATIEASVKTAEEKPSTRTKKRSTSIDVEAKQTTIEASGKTAEEKPSTRTRKRSTSVDVEAKQATIEASVKTAEEKPSTRTRKRSTSVNTEAKSVTTIEASTKTAEEKPATRTRKRSTSVDIDAKSVAIEASAKTAEEKPATRTRKRSTSVDVEPKPATIEPVRSSTRRRSVNTEIEPSSKSPEEKPIKPSTRTKTRSTSIDLESKPPPKEQSIKTTPRTRKRSTSVDLEDPIEPKISTPKRSTRASSVINLPVIEEETQPLSRTTRASSVESSASQRSKRGSSPKKSPARRGRKRSVQSDVIDEESESISAEQSKRTALEDIPEKIEEYSATHRLTRSQKMIMEKSLERQEMKKLEAKVAKPRVADFDPINLLDKESFSGSPDLDERHTRSTSPASSVGTQSSAATHVTPESVTPSRRGARRASQNTTPGTPRRSTRTMSRDMPADDEVSSVRSVPVVRRVPVVELDRMEVERHRSLSPTALLQESAATSSRDRKKSRKSSVFPVQTDLSKIIEENSMEHDHATSAAAPEATKDSRPKRGRPRKHKTESQESQSSQRPDSQERKATFKSGASSYKSLEEYFPRYSAYSTRKTFKIKKLTRKSAQ